MNTIVINKLLSHDDTMTLIRNACVGLDITLTEHDIEKIDQCIYYFFSLIKNHAGDRRFCVRISVSFQRGQGLRMSISDNYISVYLGSTTNYNDDKVDSYVFCMKRRQGSFVESITSVECCQEYPFF